MLHLASSRIFKQLSRAIQGRRFALLVFALVCALPATLHAQFNASLSGSVLDPTKAAIPGATVTLTNTQTHQLQTTKSGAAGTYQFNELAPGTYSLQVTAQGFQQGVLSDITVSAETARSADITLATGQENQTITVSADTLATLQTTDASIGTTIDNQEITRLPIFGADPYELLRTAPGISGDGARSGSGNAVFLPNGAGPGGSNSGVFQTENQVQISADGQRVSDNNYIIDGVSANSLTHGGSAVVTPNQEAIGAITIVSTSYDASLGRNTGAQIQVVTKQGTNALHGSAFFIYDEPGFNSVNAYGGPAPGTLPVRNDNKQRTWAASLGGPIMHDKLFFFLSFQEYKQNNPSFTTAYTETPQFRSAITAQRAGGVSESIIANPASQARVINIIAPSCTGFGTYQTSATTTALACQVVNGGLDLGSLTPGGTSQIGVFPTSSLPSGIYGPTQQQVGGGFDGVPDIENAQILVPSQSRGNQYNARIDYQATKKDLIAGSVYFTKLANLGASGTEGARPLDDVPFKPLNSAGTIIFVHTFSPNWINEARANFTRFADNALNDAGNTVNYGIPYDNVQNYPYAIQYGVAASTSTPANFAENTYEFRDQVSHVMGAHTIRFGAELRWEQDNDNLYGYVRPTYAFNGLWAFANDASVYESVYADPRTGGPANTQRYFRSQDYAGYIQHDWKVTSNFTFNTGLRWELFTPISNKGAPINYPVLGPTGTELAGMKLTPHNSLYNLQHNNWGPRVGFAYTPALFQNKLVIRGGYALAYNRLDISLFNNAVEDGPGVANFGLCCGTSAASAAAAGIQYAKGTSNSPTSFPINKALATGTNANGFPLGIAVPGQSPTAPQIEVYGALPNMKYPSSDLYSLEIQREFFFGSSVTFGYAGSSGRHYARLVNQPFLYNQANSPVFAAYFAQTDSVQNYNSFNLQLRRPVRHGISYSMVYTYAKAMDQVSNGDQANGAANQTNPANNRSEYGPSDYDIKHRFVATVLYQSPNLHTGSALMNMLGSGFQINATYTYHTGFPWTPVTTNLNTVPIQNGAATQNVVRPVAYYGGAGTSCSNSAFTTGSNFSNRFVGGTNVGGANYFQTILAPTAVYSPGIGRNSFRGPCYSDLDMSFAKEFAHSFGDHHTLLRFQANMFNIANTLQLQPIGNNTGGSNIASPYFGYAQSGDQGRAIELLARFQF